MKISIVFPEYCFGYGFRHRGKRYQQGFPAVLYGKEAKKLGLGLALCERNIRNHGGKITVERSSAKGTTFKVTLPLEGTQKAKENLSLSHQDPALRLI